MYTHYMHVRNVKFFYRLKSFISLLHEERKREKMSPEFRGVRRMISFLLQNMIRGRNALKTVGIERDDVKKGKGGKAEKRENIRMDDDDVSLLPSHLLSSTHFSALLTRIILIIGSCCCCCRYTTSCFPFFF